MEYDESKHQYIDTNVRQEWWYRPARKISPLGDGRVIARVLIAKLPARDAQQVGDLAQILREVIIVQEDPTFTCRVWVLHAMEYLREHGYPRMPEPSTDFEQAAKAFAIESKASLLGPNPKTVLKVIYVSCP
jgi:hypothetical protein